MRISIQSLGCPKNFVDSELICGYLLEKNHTITNDIEKSDVAIINTCSFIQSAVEESIDTILQTAKLKDEGKIKHIIVAGCLPQRYNQQELFQSLPEVDAFIGADEIINIDEIIKNIDSKNPIFKVKIKPCFIYNETSPRFILTPRHYAYIKISEGCNNRCTYCLIPGIKGSYRSRPISSIVNETKNLCQNYPLKEIILIAEDTTYYGMDIYGKFALSDLLEEISKLNIDKELKIRILYTHPAHFDDKLIETIAKNKIICPYLDIPLQHISDKILQRMNRKTSQKDILSLIKKLRKSIPDLTLRTTFIVGFPGETDDDFQQLYEFIQEYPIERVGVFPFYNEDECPAHNLPDHIPHRIKKSRLDKLMKLQQIISVKLQAAQIGKEKDVLVDSFSEDNKEILSGRSCAEAPEIDGDISILNGHSDDIGKWIKVKILNAHPYNLIGEKICK